MRLLMLVDLSKGDKFKIVGDIRVPPAHRELSRDEVFTFINLDGMYSLCKDSDNRAVHLVMWSEVKKV